MATAGLTTDEMKLVEDFRRDVVEPSQTKLVILDFWAEWCGPCKALTPVIEKVAAEYADKGVILRKINVDENNFIASQFQVRSIPTVYALFQGQPVADLTSARSEEQLKSALDQILAQIPVQPGAAGEAPKQDVAPLITMGEDVLADGDGERAYGIFAQILQIEPENAAAIAGMVRALVTAGRMDEAEGILASLPEKLASDPAIDRARSALALAKDRPSDDALDALKADAAANPGDMQKQFELANGLFGAGDRQAAADILLNLIAVEREWNEGAAKQRLLQIFETVGLEDPWVASTRRRLSAILFG